MTTSCWDDVVFTEKTFRVVSCGFVDGGFEEFRNFHITSLLHYSITKKGSEFRVQSLEFRVQSSKFF